MRRSVAFVLSLTLILSASSINWGVVSAESVDDLNEQIKELEKDKLDLKEKQNDLDSDISDTEKKIEENLEKQDSVQSDMDSIDQQLEETKGSIQAKENEITVTNQEIEDLTDKIEELKEQIEELKEEIKVLEEKIEKREELLKERLRAIQKNGGTMRYLEVVLGSSSFADFITRTAAVNVMMDQDKAIMETLKEDRITVETKKTEVEDNKSEVEDKKGEIEDKKVALEGQKQELVALQGQLDQQMAEKETLKAELEEEHNHLEEYKMTVAEEQETISAQEAAVQEAMRIANVEIEKEKEKEKERLEQLAKEENNSGVSDDSSNGSTTPPPSSGNGNGIFSWPTSGSVSSYYGGRWGSNHNGIDIASSTASSGGDVAIRAAAPGVVFRAYKSSSYGNTVFITHSIGGQTWTTVYAHLKYSPSVSVGQVVSEGQQIGIMGNTGNVYPVPNASRPYSGTHLHFEVHKGLWNMSKSNAVNPMSYLK